MSTFRTAMIRTAMVLRPVRDDERGATLVEYALMLALIAVVCVAALSALGGTVSGTFSEMDSELG